MTFKGSLWCAFILDPISLFLVGVFVSKKKKKKKNLKALKPLVYKLLKQSKENNIQL